MFCEQELLEQPEKGIPFQASITKFIPPARRFQLIWADQSLLSPPSPPPPKEAGVAGTGSNHHGQRLYAPALLR